MHCNLQFTQDKVVKVPGVGFLAPCQVNPPGRQVPNSGMVLKGWRGSKQVPAIVWPHPSTATAPVPGWENQKKWVIAGTSWQLMRGFAAISDSQLLPLDDDRQQVMREESQLAKSPHHSLRIVVHIVRLLVSAKFVLLLLHLSVIVIVIAPIVIVIAPIHPAKGFHSRSLPLPHIFRASPERKLSAQMINVEKVFRFWMLLSLMNPYKPSWLLLIKAIWLQGKTPQQEDTRRRADYKTSCIFWDGTGENRLRNRWRCLFVDVWFGFGFDRRTPDKWEFCERFQKKNNLLFKLRLSIYFQILFHIRTAVLKEEVPSEIQST